MKRLILFTLVIVLCYSLMDQSALKAIENDDPETTAYFWLYADIHLDLRYKEGANPNCGTPVCCREMSANQTAFAGKFGMYSHCDAPMILYQSALEFAAKYPLTPEFVVYVGDNVAHDDWEQTREINLDYAKVVHDALKTAFPKTLVLSTIGNHDSFPVDQLDTPPNGAWFLKPMTQILSTWLPPSALQTFEYGGYYSLLIRPGFRVISLNTQYTNPINFWLYRNLTDPANQLQWLTGELVKAEQANEKVFIIGHIPPGIALHDYKPSCTVPFNDGLLRLVERYQKTIVAQWYGHVHHDFFKMFMNKNNTNPTGVMFSCPAVTTYSTTNPAVRLVKYNKNTLELVDMVTFYGNLTEANAKGEMTWRFEYSVKDAFGMKDLSIESWYQVLSKLKDLNAPEWNTYMTYYTVLMGKPCGSADCRKKTYCSMKHMDYNSYHACLNE